MYNPPLQPVSWEDLTGVEVVNQGSKLVSLGVPEGFYRRAGHSSGPTKMLTTEEYAQS